jgi:hypothetical protein
VTAGEAPKRVSRANGQSGRGESRREHLQCRKPADLKILEVDGDPSDIEEQLRQRLADRADSGPVQLAAERQHGVVRLAVQRDRQRLARGNVTA